MANNIPETIEADNHIPETNRIINNVPETIKPKYYGQGKYNNVTLRLDPQLFQSIKFMAVREHTTIVSLVSEAIATWIKWLRKAARQEAVMEEAEKTAEELKEATKILNAILLERKLTRRARGRHKKVADKNLSFYGWVRRHPDRSWPGRGKRSRRGRPKRGEED